MITVDEALDHLFSQVTPLDTEEVPLIRAAGSCSDDVTRAGQPSLTPGLAQGTPPVVRGC